MSTKDPNAGLLSKVAKFVRNPTTNWTDLDKQEPEPEAGYSKQALKEMIERKRQNDFVRKREFDQLRRLRNRDPNAGNSDLARPSYFQSSMPANSNERAMTIKKIDEIEAQMSNQWWQGKHGTPPPAAVAGTAAPASGTPTPPPPSAAAKAAADPMMAPSKLDDQAYAPTRLSPMVPMPEAAAPEQPDFPPTRPNSSFGKNSVITTLPSPSQLGHPSLPSVPPTLPPRTQPGLGFGNSQPFAAELAEGAADADLEEAAIRFANGDNAGAEAGLLAALRTAAVRPELVDTWTAALFDLYRATGQQARFDALALDYAERHGRSAPAWFSMAERIAGGKADTPVERTLPSRLHDDPVWRSPAALDRAAMDTLQLAIANVAPPWYLDWSALESLQPEVLGTLGALFAEWCSTPVQLRFAGAEALEQALRRSTPAADRSVDPAHWRLRMDALRAMQLQDEFELVALEYCVTFEVSPPAWQEARCRCHRESGNAGNSTMGGAISVVSSLDTLSRDEGGGPSSSMGMDAPPPTIVELSGEIFGEATEALKKLEKARDGSSRMVVSCANLIRVDFSAAGSILNWVATRQAEGCSLQFRDVHRLVAAFFNVIGIHEHAKVVVRST